MVGKKNEATDKPAKDASSEKSFPKNGTEKKKAIVPPKDAADFYIVGIGASAGGLEAFEKFFEHMPNHSGMAFVLVPHLDPTHVSLMPELIQKKTDMPVHQVKDGTRVMPNTVYIVPPNHELAILNGTFQLMEPSKIAHPRMPIDYFFRSLAQDRGDKAVCIILSGMGSDGTLGLRAIKGEMGMAMVQSVESARYDSMPKRACDTDLADYVLAPEEMPQKLMGYAEHARCKPPLPRPAASQQILPDALQKIFLLLRTHTGHDFSSYKPNTICRRIERRMQVHQIEKINTYVRYLQENALEVETLFKELLIGVTNFFRDGEAFDVMKEKALPLMLQKRSGGGPLRAWVPGCSSGEEAYSLAILLRECTLNLGVQAEIQVFATDIDDTAIEKARQGIYPAGIAADVGPERLKRYFIQENNTFRISKDIREMLVFAPQDIIKDPPFTKLDLVSCRNLLIYLEGAMQKKLLPLFHYSLRPGGILFLGSSESIGEFTDLFFPIDRKWKIYGRKEGGVLDRQPMAFPISSSLDIPLIPEKGEPEPLSVSRLAEKALLDTYAPPGVIINDLGRVLYIHGRTGKFLEPAPGEANMNLFEMAREGLRLELPTIVHRAVSRRKKAIVRGVKVKTNGDFTLVDITVMPLGKEVGNPKVYLVVFEERSPVEVRKQTPEKKGGTKKPGGVASDLEKELRHTKENLQTTIEELETANEELKSTNEELQSTNEELQSTNEELETSKEEQQSMNEELSTVNAELQGKLDEFTAVNNDMKNFLDSIEIPTLFLDTSLCIRRFTAHATRVIHLIGTDVGRPLSHISTRLKEDHVMEDANGVLKDLVTRTREVETREGHWYLMRVLPYRTVDNVIDGVVVSFTDIHEEKTAREKILELSRSMEEARDFAESIINTVREPLLVLDQDLRVVSANSSFYKKFRVTPEETGSKRIYDLGDKQWDIPKLRELLETIIPENNVFEDFEVTHDFPGIGKKKMLLNARKVKGAVEEKTLILLAIEEVA